LYDPIQIRLTQSHTPRNGPQPNHHIHIPVQHFTVAALKDAWAYDDEEDEEGPDGSEAASEGSNLVGTISSRRSRLSVLGGVAVGSLRDKKDRRDAGIEKRGNVTKVGLEVEVLMGASGPIEVSHIRCRGRS
jgi:dynactin-4